MSKYIATRAIRGANALVAEAMALLEKAIAEKGEDAVVSFPNTAYFLPVIHGMLGLEVSTLGGLRQVMAHARSMLHPLPRGQIWSPYLGETLDCGQATLLAAETIEAVRFVYGEQPERYPGFQMSGSTAYANDGSGRDHLNGPIDDIQLRSWGIQLVDGRMPGFAAIVGCAKSNEVAVQIVRELQRRNILVFLSGNVNGRSIIDQLHEEGVEMGYDTYIVPFGRDTLSAIYALGFATRSALTFGGMKGGQWHDILLYNKFRVFAFVLALGEVDDLKYAAAAGAISYGFPTIADTLIPEILPTGVTRYEHVISMPFNEIEGKDDLERAERIVQKAIEVRGVKLKISEVPVPVPYGSAFEGEVVRRADMQVEFGGRGSRAFEYLRMAPMDAVTDGDIQIIGPGLEGREVGASIDLGILIEVAGRKMQTDFEPVLERQIHYFVNGASGVQHIGQRDIAWIRVSKAAYEKGFGLEHFGKILHARFHADFGAIVDKVQVKILTDPDEHAKWLARAREAYDVRNIRLADMTDESVDTFYSCILCQSFAPDHVCVVSPERLGLCGAYNWLDCKASYEINPTGPNQPIIKGECIDPAIGYWKGTNEYALQASHGSVPRVSLYSIMSNPMTACGCFECIAMVIPEANGIMVVSREDPGMTPAGMKFSTLAGIAGGGIQTPGMMGIGKYYMLSKKFISADGGFKRVVWMSKNLKDTMAAEFQAVAEREGDHELINRIADGDSVTEVDELVKWLEEHDHPALKMEPMQAAPEPEEGAERVAVAAAAAPAKAAASAPASTPVAQAKPAAEPAAQEAEARTPAVQQPTVAPEAAPKRAASVPEVVSSDARAIAQMSADIVLDQIRNALAAALNQLGGTVPLAPAPPAAPAAAPEPEPEAEPAPEPEPVKPRKERATPVGAPWIKDESAGVQLVTEKRTGQVIQVTLGATPAQGGTRSRVLTLGGETTLPYLFTEGGMPNRPGLAIEISDRKPNDWSPLLLEVWGDVMDDPGRWARAAEDRGADAILLQLSATTADDAPTTAANARATVRRVLDATGLPLIVYGPGQVELDNELLVAVAEEGKGERLVLGKCEEKNYRTIVAAALANEQLVIASTAMDVNLAKQLNILISDMGLSLDRIVMDPTCAAVGYGMEYGYSVMERLRLAALNGDRMTQLPMIVTVGYEAWRQKEAKTDRGVPEAWGDWTERAINWETMTAAALVESAANLIVLRHPEALRRIRAMIDELWAGNNQGG
ncbi:MAG: CO dehydrogenase/CO-methylating acetyl-CoA synthase complex subunit beta [Anaerolineae bacterium]|nr:CO dehydrogenase/CO-methylating acetyl-CoA synthase complex subunit beta [Anaerolineae bacterium]